MIRLSISLPKKYRLDLHLVHDRRQKPHAKFIIPAPSTILNIRSGSKISRVFTHIFSHRYIKKILGANIAFAIIASGLMPVNTHFDGEFVGNTVTTQEILTTTQKGTRYPTDEIKVTQGYQLFHPGIDFDGLTGDKIYPILSGKVEDIQYSRFAYGNAVMVGHGGNLSSLYAHLSKISVKVGDEVNINEPIGEMGATGRASGDHLHLEVHDNGRPINPRTLLPR